MEETVKDDELPLILNFYEKLLIYSAPLFSLVEAIATALVILISRYSVRKLLDENNTITVRMDILTATLIGSIITLSLVLTYKSIIIDNNGMITDGALLFAYTIYCIYMLSFNWNQNKNNNIRKEDSIAVLMDKENNMSPSPLIIFRNFSDLSSSLVESLLNINSKVIIKWIFDFVGNIRSIIAIQKALSLQVFISLVYRITVVSITFYKLNKSAEIRNREEEEEKSLRILNFITSLTTPMIIAVYTHLLLCHYDYLDTENPFWRWTCIIICWGVYFQYLKEADDF
ncbi:9800_t:CDS:2 [Diversispora eburnea]|uniref:9800_t:CDS:1 n=1 Tax=Diversispora eburnea TaxID=1213867 RepID=A0A9N8VAF3_9GLOM|nr:9800_t:CDS:2 [Diversispora eburnea]